MPRIGRRNVGVAIITELACYRDMIRGINAYAAMQGNWQVELLGVYEDLAGLAREREMDGLVIGPVPDLKVAARAVKAVKGHAVGIGGQFTYRGLDLTEVESDDVAVGRLAAEHLLAKGFKHFAYIGAEAEWSELRGAGFIQALAEAGFEVAALNPDTTVAQDARGWRMPHFGHDLGEWLIKLPKPLALFACNDLRGRALIDLCRNESLRVPDEVAILAVDNDDLICELAQPQLSSVLIPWKRIGFQAAATLDKLFGSRQRGKTQRLVVGPESVIERQSTDTLAVDDPDVAAAMRFIRTHAHEPINVEDLLRHLPVARRSLEKRFREVIGRSPLEEIRKAHTERAKYLLAETDLSMPEIADKSGFSSAAWFSKAFHDMTGETPTQYRQKFHTR